MWIYFYFVFIEVFVLVRVFDELILNEGDIVRLICEIFGSL